MFVKKVWYGLFFVAVLFSMQLFAQTQTLSLTQGWNLVGSKLDSVTLSTTSDDTIEVVWKYNDGKWENNPTALSAGEGFWIKTTSENKSLALTGSESTKTLSFAKSGWHLVSPISATLDAATQFASDDYTALWTYNAGKWSNKSAITTISAGKGFWVKTGKDGLSLAQVMEPVLSGSVDLTGLVSDTTTKSLRSIFRDDMPPMIPDEATVQVYSVDDEDMENPLLEDAVSMNEDGSYTVTDDDFVGDTPPQVPGFIVRVIAQKDGENFELSAMKTDDAPVEVCPFFVWLFVVLRYRS